MTTKIFTSAILCALLFAGCGNKQASSNNTDDSGGLTTKVGDTFVIRLEANHTTGYSWSLVDSTPGIVQKVSDVYEPYNTTGNIVGSGGTEIWTFKAIAKGTVTLTFDYVRPWETNVAPIKEQIYVVTVK